MTDATDRQQPFGPPNRKLDRKPTRPEAGVPQPTSSAQPSIDLPGCEPLPMTRAQYNLNVRRLELWDAGTKTAWVLRDAPLEEHEIPAQRLTQMVTLIGAVRGSTIAVHGSRGLVRRGPDPRERIPHPDQTLFLHPARAEVRPSDNILLMADRSYPDVVLEVDHTTDVRRGKLALYEGLGIPELWVETPDIGAPSRPTALQPGLRIYLRRKGRFEIAPTSRAFPGWAAQDIHRSMNEEYFPSGRTHALLERLGREMGGREGTGPDDFPLMRSLRQESRAAGHAKGLAEGLAEGRTALMKAYAQAARHTLKVRGIQVSDGFPADVPGFAELSMDAVLELALASASEADFRNRLRGR